MGSELFIVCGGIVDVLLGLEVGIVVTVLVVWRV